MFALVKKKFRRKMLPFDLRCFGRSVDFTFDTDIIG